MLLRSLHVGTAGAVAIVVMACGAKLVVDQEGHGGGVTATSSTTLSSSPTVDVELCGQACTALAAKGCAGAGCEATCQEVMDGACGGAAGPLLSCLRDEAASASSCFVEACNYFRVQLEACASQGTCKDTLLGESGTGLCLGKGICGAGERAANCDASGACTCLFEDGSMSTCQDSGPFLCDFADGCCAMGA